MSRESDVTENVAPPEVFRATFISGIKNKWLRRISMVCGFIPLVVFNIVMPFIGSVIVFFLMFSVSSLENVSLLCKSFKEKW